MGPIGDLAFADDLDLARRDRLDRNGCDQQPLVGVGDFRGADGQLAVAIVGDHHCRLACVLVANDCARLERVELGTTHGAICG